jgi:hypothetical protein
MHPHRDKKPHSAEIKRLIEAVRLEGEPDQYAGKRHSTRFADGLVLEMTTDTNRADRSHMVYMHNISDGGFAFWSRNKIPTRSTIFIREPAEHGHRPWIKALVTHCTFGIRGFLIGASFEPVTPA